MENEMNKLFRFYVDYGRNGALEGLFVATEDELNLLTNCTVYFGEAFGKHSEVWLDDFNWNECCTVISDDQEKIDWLTDILGYSLSGYNPLEYFYINDNEEYREGYYSNDDYCEYEVGTPEYLRWNVGRQDKKNEN